MSAQEHKLTQTLVLDEKKAQNAQKAAQKPFVLPTFDGSPTATKEPPSGEYKLAALPNAKNLFDMVVSCWPEKSWFRGELSAEARANRRITDSATTSTTSFDPVTGQYTTQGSGTERFVGVVFRIPLYSAVELDKEREREIVRRSKISDAVGDYVTALAEWQMDERELALMKSLEKRAQERVQLGVTETGEQVKYLEKVAHVDRNLIKNRAKLIKSRVQLQGFCDSGKAWIVDEYLKRFKDVN